MNIKYLTSILFIITPLAFSAVPSDSQYHTDDRDFLVEDTLNDATDTPTMILCFMSSMRPDLMVNKGTYLALVDEEACNSSGQIKSGPQSQDKASQAGQSSSASSISYTEAIVSATRASSTAAMLGPTWITVEGPAGDMDVFVSSSVTSAPTSSNPYGVFSMDYTANDGASDIMFGRLQANTSGLLQWYESMSFQGMTFIDQLALTQNVDAGTGYGAVSKTDGQSGVVTEYGFAYDTDGYCRKMLSYDGGAASDTDEYCFSTSETSGIKTIWDYDLYDATSGARYDLAVKGFPVTTNISGTKYFGYANYHGIHFDSSIVASIGDGSTITEDTGGVAGDSYIVRIGMGKLDKVTKSFRTLESMDKYPMNSFLDISALSISASEYKFYYDHSNLKFVLTHNRVCTDGQGCFDTPLSPNLEFTLAQYLDLGVESGYSGIGYWVPGLGGGWMSREAMINPFSDTPGASVELETEERVKPEDYPEILYCVEGCFDNTSISAFITKIQASTHTSEDHPYDTDNYRTSSITAANLKTYIATGMTYYSSGLEAAYPNDLSSDDTDNIDQTAANWGARTGPLVTDLADFKCASWRTGKDYCTDGIWDGSVSTYYVWRTGHKRWDKNYNLIDSSGSAVTFSAPEKMYYQVPTGAAYGNFSGKEVALDYRGSGQLRGFPGACYNATTGAFTDSCGSYGSWLPWVDRFEIPFDEDTGFVTAEPNQSGKKYLVKARFGAVFLALLPSKIGTLTLGTTADLPGAIYLNVGPNGGVNYIGAKPTQPDSATIIHGVLQ